MRWLMVLILLVGCTTVEPVKQNDFKQADITQEPEEVPEEPLDNVQEPDAIEHVPDVELDSESELDCGGPVGLDCTAVLEQGIIKAEFTNNLGEDISITKLTQYNDEEPWSSITYCETDQDLSLEIADGESFKVEIDCSGFDRLDQGFEITYNGLPGYIRIKS